MSRNTTSGMRLPVSREKYWENQRDQRNPKMEMNWALLSTDAASLRGSSRSEHSTGNSGPPLKGMAEWET